MTLGLSAKSPLVNPRKLRRLAVKAEELTLFDWIGDRTSCKRDVKRAKESAQEVIDKLKTPSEKLPEDVKLRVTKELAYDGHYGPCGVARYRGTAVLNMRYPGLGSAPCTFRLKETSPDMDYRKFGGIDRMNQYLSETENPAQDMLTNYLSNVASIINDKVLNGMSIRRANKKVKAMQDFINTHCPDSKENNEILENLKRSVSENVITDKAERIKAKVRYALFGEQ